MSGEGVQEEFPHSGDSQPGPSGINSTSAYNRFTARTFPQPEKASTSGHQAASAGASSSSNPTSSEPRPASNTPEDTAADDRPTSAAFECNICLDVAKDAVVSMCGHLFCWPCIFQWFETRPNSPLCPVCKAGISKDKVVPIYGHGNEGKVDPRDKVPPRPQGTRPTPDPSSAFNNLGFGEGGLQLSFGIGAFPFSIFASTFNIGGGVQAGNTPQTNPANQDPGVQEINEFLQKIFLYIAALFMIWLLVA